MIVREEDVFARCSDCNCDSFLYVNPKVIIDVKNAAQNHPVRNPLIHVEGGTINVNSGTITEGKVKIQYEDVHFPVLKSVPVIYVCKKCGKCYWDGSHFDRFYKEIDPLVQHHNNPNPIPPPPPLQASSSSERKTNKSTKKQWRPPLNPIPPPPSSSDD